MVGKYRGTKSIWNQTGLGEYQFNVRNYIATLIVVDNGQLWQGINYGNDRMKEFTLKNDTISREIEEMNANGDFSKWEYRAWSMSGYNVYTISYAKPTFDESFNDIISIPRSLSLSMVGRDNISMQYLIQKHYTDSYRNGTMNGPNPMTLVMRDGTVTMETLKETVQYVPSSPVILIPKTSLELTKRWKSRRRLPHLFSQRTSSSLSYNHIKRHYTK